MFDEGGTWREEEAEVEAVFVSYFKALFTSGGSVDMEQVINTVDSRVTGEMNTF